MQLILVRHGECVANAEGFVAGSTIDSPLTEHGIAQARATGQALKGRKVDAIIASPMARTHHTAGIIQAEAFPGLTVTIEPLFTERDSGEATGTDRNDYLARVSRDEYIVGAETVEAMLIRAQAGLAKLHQDFETVVIVTHEGTARAIQCAAYGLPPSAIATIVGLGNAEVREIQYEPTARPINAD